MFRSTETDAVIAWVTPDFQLYACASHTAITRIFSVSRALNLRLLSYAVFGPLATKSQAIIACNRIVRSGQCDAAARQT